MMDSDIQANRVHVLCNEAHLRHNFRFLCEFGSLLPIVKADAYGHGMLFTAKVLADEGVEAMAVCTLYEGQALRQAGIQGEIILLMGFLGLDEAHAVLKYQLTPLVHSFVCMEHLEAAAKTLGVSHVPVALKLDTGFRRLGFRERDLPEVLARMYAKAYLTPRYVLSHCAAADDPDLDAYTVKQYEQFAHMAGMVRELFPAARMSFSNSAALRTFQADLQVHTKDTGQAQELWGRPGLALYGLNPLYGTSRASLYDTLKPVMSVTAPVLAVHEIQAGEHVGYGCRFTAPQAMQVAVVGIGYCYGYMRQLEKACMLVRGVRAPVIGRVCMHMTMLDISHVEGVAHGDRVYVLGAPPNAEPITAYELAELAHTIPYEILCSLGKNVHLSAEQMP